MVDKNAGVYVVVPGDNVGTLTQTAGPGEAACLGAEIGKTLELLCEIPRGHKAALCDILSEQPIMKYGARIGTASRDIAKGEHVHLHNMKSDFDERSATLDVETAASTDVEYKVY